MVGTGDTLWDIAAEHADDGDVLEMMEHIKDLNDLDSAPCRPARSSACRPSSHTDFVSRLDPGWRAGEDEGRGYPRGSLAPRGIWSRYAINERFVGRVGRAPGEPYRDPYDSTPWPATQAPRW